MVFLLCGGVVGLFACRKNGLFIDEVYSYGLANSSYAPYLTDVKGGRLTDQVFTPEEVNDYLSAGLTDAFSFSSVYYNQTKDVHPPLYYWLLHTVSSFFPGTFSIWIGTGLNIGIFFLSLLALYFFVKRLFGSIPIAAVSVILFGTSVLSLSMVMMIRMYTLLAFFTILLASITMRILQDPENNLLYPLLTFIVFCGMMTQYYFAFYAFFLCALTVFYLIFKKRWNSLLWFSICAVLGVVLMIAVFPASIRQLFVGNGQVVGGSTVLDTLRETSAYRQRIEEFWKVRFKLKGLSITLLSAAVLALLLSVGVVRAAKAGKIRFDALLLILPVIPAFLFTAIISPVLEQRYVYNLIPIAVLGCCFLLHIAEEGYKAAIISRTEGKKAAAVSYFSGVLLVCAVSVLSILCAKRLPPDNLFADHRILNELCDAHASSPCVYISNEKFASPTQDLLQLKRFDSFFVTNNPSSQKMKEYIGDAEEAVLYIDTNKFWSSGYDADSVLSEFAESTGLTNSRLLYSFSYEGIDGLSSTYILSR